MQEEKEVEVNERREEATEPLPIISENIMQVLRESREDILSVLPHVLERLEVRRLQETLKHEIEEATYISIREILRGTLDDALAKVLDERIEKAVEDVFRDVVRHRLKEEKLEEYIKREIERKLADYIEEQAYEAGRHWREEYLFYTFKEKVKEQVLNEIGEDVVKELKEQALEQLKKEQPLLAQALGELSRRIDSLENSINALRGELNILRGGERY